MEKHYYKSDIYGPNILAERFAAEIIEKDFRHSITITYHADEITDFWDKAQYTYSDGDTRKTRHGLFTTWASVNGIAYLFQFPQGGVTLHAAAGNRRDLDHIVTGLRLAIPEAELDNQENRIPIRFWYLSPQGPVQTIRKLSVPDWDDIRQNYSGKTRASLDQLMTDDFRPTSGGQFILWLGEPGTGKTTALRALGKRWRDWCDIQFITDPDRFFGSGADYMMKFLMQSSESDDSRMWDIGQILSEGEPDVPEEEEEDEKDRWMLLVFEDTGELLTKTAKAETGQGLSRFLNVVDGLIGQGLKIVVLVTTNEDYDSFNKAVIRPGRCRAKIEFTDLNKDEANEWAEVNGIDLKVQTAKSLADLYALKNEQIKTEENKQVLGF